MRISDWSSDVCSSDLSKLGYKVVASSGKASEAEYLTALGAAQIIDRNELSNAGKPLQKERWAAVVDCVGSHTLANALAQTRYGGFVAARSGEHTSELQSLMRISYAVVRLKKKSKQ